MSTSCCGFPRDAPLTPLVAALALLPSFAVQAQAVRSQKDLRLYLATAAHYGSGYRTAALREIRQWGVPEIAGATAARLSK